MAKKTKTVGQLTKQLQPIFNLAIRLRDKGKPCVSCGEYKPFEDMDCGHFYAKSGYAGLRFDEDNCASECKYCNRFDESHLIGYAENLKQRIGDKDYNALKERAADYKRNGYKFGRGELKELLEKYKNKIRILNNNN